MDITFVYNSEEGQYAIIGYSKVDTDLDQLVLSTIYPKERLFFVNGSEDPFELNDTLPYIPFPGYTPPTTD